MKKDAKKEIEKIADNMQKNEEFYLNNSISKDAERIFNSCIPKEVCSSIDNLKHIISKNAGLYREIKNTEVLEYKSIRSYVDDVNQLFNPKKQTQKKQNDHKVKEKDKSNMFCKVNLRNFQRNLTSTCEVGISSLSYMNSTINEESTINKLDTTVSIRDFFVYVLYGADKNKHNSYTLKTFSRYYPYYLILNINNILDNALTFNVHNSLCDKSENIRNDIELSIKDKTTAEKELILFMYLLERGTGLGFKRLLYSYAQKYQEEILSKKNQCCTYTMDIFLHCMTSFKLVCLFPSEDFFKEIYQIFTTLMDAYVAATQKYNDQIAEKDFTIAFKNKLKNIIQELFIHQNHAISRHEKIVEYNFFDSRFERKYDRSQPNIQLWNDVQHYVNAYVKCDNHLKRFDLDICNNLDKYNALMVQLNSIKDQIAILKSQFYLL